MLADPKQCDHATDLRNRSRVFDHLDRLCRVEPNACIDRTRAVVVILGARALVGMGLLGERYVAGKAFREKPRPMIARMRSFETSLRSPHTGLELGPRTQ